VLELESSGLNKQFVQALAAKINRLSMEMTHTRRKKNGKWSRTSYSDQTYPEVDRRPLHRDLSN
jgi:hypothetical protein